MNKTITKKNIWDAGRWRFTSKARFDFMTFYIFERMKKFVDLKDKHILELGAGTGRLSFCALKEGAASVTLVDNSSKARSLAVMLFKDAGSDNVSIIDEDILSFKGNRLYDIVFSSGLIEHFRNEDRPAIVKKHIELSKRDVLFIHPTDTLYARLFNLCPLALYLYGYQRSFSEKEMNSYLERQGYSSDATTHDMFYPFYSVPVLHNREHLNRCFESSFLPGGLTLTHVLKK